MNYAQKAREIRNERFERWFLAQCPSIPNDEDLVAEGLKRLAKSNPTEMGILHWLGCGGRFENGKSLHLRIGLGKGRVTIGCVTFSFDWVGREPWVRSMKASFKGVEYSDVLYGGRSWMYLFPDIIREHIYLMLLRP